VRVKKTKAKSIAKENRAKDITRGTRGLRAANNKKAKTIFFFFFFILYSLLLY
jgi:hypothetical protein